MITAPWDADGALAPLPFVPWSGEVWRVHLVRFLPDDATGSILASGRFHRAEAQYPTTAHWRALYLSLSPDIPIGEILRRFPASRAGRARPFAPARRCRRAAQSPRRRRLAPPYSVGEAVGTRSGCRRASIRPHPLSMGDTVPVDSLPKTLSSVSSGNQSGAMSNRCSLRRTIPCAPFDMSRPYHTRRGRSFSL